MIIIIFNLSSSFSQLGQEEVMFIILIVKTDFFQKLASFLCRPLDEPTCLDHMISLNMIMKFHAAIEYSYVRNCYWGEP